MMAAVAAVLQMPRKYSTQKDEKCCTFSQISAVFYSPPKQPVGRVNHRKIILQTVESVT
jgi:hypothetical protein